MPSTRLIKQRPVWSFCLLTLLWSFSWWSLILVVTPLGTLSDPPLNPAALAFAVIGGLGPSLAALVTTRLLDGKGSAMALLRRLGHWRIGWWWLAILLPYAVNVAFVASYVLAGGRVSSAAIVRMIGPAIAVGMVAGLSEEFGWRGFMLPQLQRRFSPLIASLLIGLFWGGVWHGYANHVGAYGDEGWRGLAMTLLLGSVQLSA